MAYLTDKKAKKPETASNDWKPVVITNYQPMGVVQWQPI
jgi:hypothetical protein